MPNEIDPRLISRLATSRTSRRRFIGGGAAAAAALAIGPSILAACGGKESGTTATTATEAGPASGTLRISNWPLYMADGFVADFQKATGITVDYKEDFNDNEQWFAKVKEPLSRKQDIGADLAVPTTFMMVRLHQLGWLNEISDAGVPNKKNIRPDLLEASVDPGRKYSAPYMSGLVGLAYNRAATGRDITTIDDMWDPAFKGKVSMFSDTQDGLGMLMMSQGNSVEKPTMETVQKAIDLVKEQKEKGQIRRFTGNDYADDLAAGNIAIAQAYSGDVVQLQADNPSLGYTLPSTGHMIWSDNFVIPNKAKHKKNAEILINYFYDPKVMAQVVDYVNYISVVKGAEQILVADDPDVAKNPLIFPSEAVLGRAHVFRGLTEAEETKYNKAFQALTTGG
jgi:spermidine/putrescine transport system substrate-binding protein